MLHEHAKYTQLRDSSDESSIAKLDDLIECPYCSQVKKSQRTCRNIWICGLVAAFIAGSIWLGLLHHVESRVAQLKSQEYLPALEACGERSVAQLKGEFKEPSKWRGAPSDSIDAAWKSITEVGAMVVDEDEVKRRGKLRESTVMLENDQSSGYMASIEAFHQLHCLDLLRKYSYLEYYKVKEPDTFNHPNIRVHADHCIELLRQVLMCTADLRLVTYDWVNEVDLPWPDFSTDHMCRDYSKVLEWAASREVRVGGGSEAIRRPANAPTRILPEAGIKGAHGRK